MRSQNGINFTAVAPPLVDWGPLGGHGTSLEVGGVARIGERYFAIGGTSNGGYHWVTGAANGYNMYTLSAENATGPFRPTPSSFRLSGTSTIPGKRPLLHALGAFVQDVDAGSTLVSNYIDSSNVYMTPLKEAVADSLGSLRLKWWGGNEALKGAAVQEFPSGLQVAALTPHTTAIAWFPEPRVYPGWNHTQGLVVTGQLAVVAAGGQLIDSSDTSVGFAFEALGSPATAATDPRGTPPGNSTRQILMSVEPVKDPTRQTVISDVTHSNPPNITTIDVSGEFPCGPNGLRCGVATKSSISAYDTHSFILLARRGMFELYVDGWLVQYHVYGECAYTMSRECAGRIGVVVNGTGVRVQLLRAWRMSLS
jgi:hypothetical protein